MLDLLVYGFGIFMVGLITVGSLMDPNHRHPRR